MANAVEIENLSFTYPDGTAALKGLSLTIKANTRVALLGPNGAGKSTLLLHFNGLNLPQQGQVRIFGREVDRQTEKWARSTVGLVFQDPDDQIFAPTVGEDVAFGPHNQGLPPLEIEHRVVTALEAVGMTAYRDKPPHHLSYGQKKRVAIAGVLAMQPQIVVLDEPMAYLDPRGREDLLQVLTALHRGGKTIIVATHDVDLAAEWAEQVIILQAGQTLAAGDGALLTDPALITAAGLTFPTVTKLFRHLPEIPVRPLPRTILAGVRAIRDWKCHSEHSEES
ncbi:MAG: ATP-binding cassette domain-containing protein [Heliobacteriaceae bacterium]|nr:ATP-binding cassette domain-containing protein [Heliobacteriaceae bacterium]